MLKGDNFSMCSNTVRMSPYNAHYMNKVYTVCNNLCNSLLRNL